ncbi:UDP-N-acetylglucosamine 2-epimerase [Humibacter sp. RRB41]|uniref:UDP-N-acetylglucosamine 2-epimerase n=1 Tax=Humibacter sp. RRB41 TaxID=2919946 RepID=UPI001FAAFF75|nr:UDP-N-acetylglucosamine 2-epimerase [Humibacter sp. RRB41]
MTVAVFVSGRADLGPLGPVLARIAEAAHELLVLTGVGFDAESAGAALADIGVNRVVVRAIGPRLVGDTPADAARTGAALSQGIAEVLDTIEVLVVLGDRWELPWVVMPAVLARVPVVHLHGGEVTEGAIDERVRHAITKLSDVHCVASTDAMDRLVQMGEDPATVHVTGAPGLDRLAEATPLSDAEIASALGVDLRRPLALFTYHPVTTESVAEMVHGAVDALLGTADAAATVIVTHPGPDPGGYAVRDALLTAVETLPNVVAVPALGARYPRVLAACDVVVGNSSSGIIEAATVNVPAVDVGTRQTGRLRAATVTHVDDGRENVKAGVQRALASPHPHGTMNPYGDGRAAARIAELILQIRRPAGPKRFRDLDARVIRRADQKETLHDE